MAARPLRRTPAPSGTGPTPATNRSTSPHRRRPMQSVMRLTMLLLATTALGACASSTRIVTPAVGCSMLVPAGWADPVPSAAFPQDAASVRDWQVFGVEQSGQLAKANGRAADVMGVVRAGEARDAETVEQIGRPWWARLRPG